MCEVCNHIATYQQLRQADPTKTNVLRANFVKDMNRRFNKIKKLIFTAVVTNDVFGLNPKIQVNTAIPKKAFQFGTNPEKVEKFMSWLNRQVEQELLTVEFRSQLGTASQAPWTNMYISDSYKRGADRAAYEAKKAKIPGAQTMAERGGIQAVMGTPMHMDRLGMLYTRTFSELKGITTAMDTQISKVLAQGIADGDSPAAIARKLNKTIGGGLDLVTKTKAGITRTIPAQVRAQTLARTEIIRAHHAATIQEYRNFGMAGVKVQAEWSTAGDDRVCPECASLEGKVYTLDEIEGLIPVHPNCFIDPQIPIYTSEGWKPIGKIEVGDYVLTHKHRFKKVYALPRQTKQMPEVVTITFRGDHKITLTANHQVLVTSKKGNLTRWIAAGSLTTAHHIKMLANRCEYCGKLVPYFKKFCNRTCLSKSITDKQWANPEHRQNISNKVSISMNNQYALGLRDKDTITKKAVLRTKELSAKGLFVLQRPEIRDIIRACTNTPEHKEASSQRMQQNNPMFNNLTKEKARASFLKYLHENPEQRLNARMAKHRKSGRKTSIEQRMAELLDMIGIDYVFQYPILNYNADFAIPSLGIVIECDGLYWHKDTEKDKERQKRIEAAGWFVLRFTDEKINKCLGSVEDEVRRVVGNHVKQYNTCSVPILDIKKWIPKKPKTLYNLSVEYDESYMAKGVVVHNCRCIALPALEEGVVEKEVITEPSWTDFTKADFKGDNWNNMIHADDSVQLQNNYISYIQSYNGVNPITIKQMNTICQTVAEDILAKLPKVKALIKEKSPVHFILENSPYSNGRSALAHYVPDTREIVFGTKSVRLKQWTKPFKGNWTTNSNLRAYTAHEYGHYVQFQLPMEKQREWFAFYREKGATYFKKEVSVYGSSNGQEAFAEVFAYYVNPRYKENPLSKELQDKIESIIGKRVDL